MTRRSTKRGSRNLERPVLEQLHKIGRSANARSQLLRYLDPAHSMPVGVAAAAATLLLQLSGVGCATLAQALEKRISSNLHEEDPASAILALALLQRGQAERPKLRRRVIEVLCKLGTFDFARAVDEQLFDDFLSKWEPGNLQEWEVVRLAQLSCNSAYELLIRLGSKHEDMAAMCHNALPRNHSGRLKIARSALDTLKPEESYWERGNRVSEFLSVVAPLADAGDQRRLVRAFRSIGSDRISAPLKSLVTRNPQLAAAVAKETLEPVNPELDAGWPIQSMLGCLPLWAVALKHGGAEAQTWVRGEFSNPPASRPPLEVLRVYVDTVGSAAKAFIIQTATNCWTPEHAEPLASALTATKSAEALDLLVEKIRNSRHEYELRVTAAAIAELDLGTSEKSLLTVVRTFNAAWAIAVVIEPLVDATLALPKENSIRSAVLNFVDQHRGHKSRTVRKKATKGWEELMGLA